MVLAGRKEDVNNKATMTKSSGSKERWRPTKKDEGKSWMNREMSWRYDVHFDKMKLMKETKYINVD
jgi:hypothetical protein